MALLTILKKSIDLLIKKKAFVLIAIDGNARL